MEVACRLGGERDSRPMVFMAAARGAVGDPPTSNPIHRIVAPTAGAQQRAISLIALPGSGTQ